VLLDVAEHILHSVRVEVVVGVRILGVVVCAAAVAVARRGELHVHQGRLV